MCYILPSRFHGRSLTFCYALMFDGMSLLAGNFGYTDKEFGFWLNWKIEDVAWIFCNEKVS